MPFKVSVELLERTNEPKESVVTLPPAPVPSMTMAALPVLIVRAAVVAVVVTAPVLLLSWREPLATVKGLFAPNGLPPVLA